MNGKGSNLTIVKEKNLRLIRRILYEKSPISRAEIAQQMELSLPTITTNVARLLSAGILRELQTDADSSAPGRRPVLLEYTTDFGYFVGVDLSPYMTYIALTDLRGNVLAQDSAPAAEEDYAQMLELLSATIDRFIESSTVPRAKILGVGVCLPGFIEADSGLVRNNRRRDWNNRLFAADLQTLLSLPVRIENNVRARAIGCELFQREFDADPLLYYYVSRGLGCSLILNKEVLYGASAGAGEIGHTIVDPNGPICDTCGNRGCLDAVASENAIRKQCRQLMSAGIPTLLTMLCENPEDPTIEEILKAQACNDKLVCGVLSDAIGYIGRNISNLATFVSPRTIVILSRLFMSEENQAALMEIIRTNVFSYADKHLNVIFLPYHTHSGAIGAAATAVQRFFLEANDED